MWRTGAVLIFLVWLGDLCFCQEDIGQGTIRRRRLRPQGITRRLAETEARKSEEASDLSEGGRRRRPLPVRKPAGRGFVSRPGVGGRGARGMGRGRGLKMRGGGGRRFPGGGRPRRPPAYYYDYYYDEMYDDYYGNEYYQDDYEYAEDDKGSTKKPALPDIGGEDYTGLITELWRQFLKEKEGGEGGRLTAKEPKVEYDCPPRSDVSYYEPDLEQCDKYIECNIKGEQKIHLCPDGFVFDPAQEKCDYPVKVNCTTRPNLQEAQPSVNCSRANGFFPWPANMSCQNFWDCREGTAYPQTCPVGVIFDPGLNTCATPDQSSRKECTQGKDSFLGFQCPEYTADSVLRFGNHERLSNPDNCQQYFTCLQTGGPRLATCSRKKVFNNVTGSCDHPKHVPGCEEFWVLKLKKEEDSDYYYDYD